MSRSAVKEKRRAVRRSIRFTKTRLVLRNSAGHVGWTSRGMTAISSAEHARSRRWLIALVVLLHAGHANAARQGSLGSTSSGSISISASVPAQARVSGLEDIELVNAGPQSPLRISQDFCVSSNSLVRFFTIAAIGSGPNGSLELSNRSQTVTYDVRWTLPGGPDPSAALSIPDGASLLVSTAAELRCGPGPGPAQLTIATDQPLPTADGPEGPYAGILTLILSPE